MFEGFDFEKLEAAGEVTFNEDQRFDLNRAASEWLDHRDERDNLPKPAAVKDRLKKIENLTRRLVKLWHADDPATKAALGNALRFPRHQRPRTREDHLQLCDLPNLLNQIADNAHRRHEFLKESFARGRPTDYLRHIFLCELFYQWRLAGGESIGVRSDNPPTGPFFELARIAMIQLGMSTQGLDGAALKAARDTRDLYFQISN